MDVLSGIADNIRRSYEMAERARIAIQQQQITSLLSDRLLPGANIYWNVNPEGLLEFSLHDPIGVVHRQQAWEDIRKFADQLFNQVVQEADKIRRERKFGGEDQVQHALLTGYLSNLTQSLLTSLILGPVL